MQSAFCTGKSYKKFNIEDVLKKKERWGVRTRIKGIVDINRVNYRG